MDTSTRSRTAEPRLEFDDRLVQLKRELHERLLASIDVAAVRTMDEPQLRRELRQGAEELCRRHPELLNLADRRRLIDELVDETLGLGPLEPLLRDPEISDILINGPRQVFVERHGTLERVNASFYSDEHLLQVLQKICARVGRRVDESSPMVDARLPDGSRVNAIIRPLALDGALVSIRRFAGKQLDARSLLVSGALSEQMLCFLAACVEGRMNILISGGTGSGKTTLLNVLSGFIPHKQRIVTVEDAAELRLQQPHVARMETRPPNLEGQGAVSCRDLLKNALRMRPDRIIIGECRGAEALDMLQAMNTGHDGSLTTVHANSAADAISRLQMLVGMAGFDLPMWHIDRQIAAAIQVVVHVARLNGGERRITQIAEVRGLHDGQIEMQDIFEFIPSGIDAAGRTLGAFQATGVVPRCLSRCAAHGIALDQNLFQAPATAASANFGKGPSA